MMGQPKEGSLHAAYFVRPSIGLLVCSGSIRAHNVISTSCGENIRAVGKGSHAADRPFPQHTLDRPIMGACLSACFFPGRKIPALSK